MSVLDEICKEIIEWHKKFDALEAENARFKNTSYEAELVGLRTELLDIKNKAAAFLDEASMGYDVIRVLIEELGGYKNGIVDERYFSMDLFRYTLRGDSGSGKDLKEAIK